MNQRRPVAAGNWKMNTGPEEGIALCRELVAALGSTRETGAAEIIVFPPYTHLAGSREALAGSRIALGAQDLFWEPKGAYTGEISAGMIRALATHVIIGHSERRQYFGETDKTVQKKLVAALAAGLVPIVCVGESLDDRDRGNAEAVLERQVRGALADVKAGASLILAYEPVWAIGTGRAATADQADGTMRFIRAVLGEVTSVELADRVRILYGGSVTAQNVAEFMSGTDIDGALVGGASLEAGSFSEIVQRIGVTAPA